VVGPTTVSAPDVAGSLCAPFFIAELLNTYSGRNAERSLPTVRLRNVPSAEGQRSIRSSMHAGVKVPEVCLQALLVLRPRQSTMPRAAVFFRLKKPARRTSRLT
jgi:hypothetical protein